MHEQVWGQGPGGNTWPGGLGLPQVTEGKRVGEMVYPPEGLLGVQASRLGSDPSRSLRGRAGRHTASPPCLQKWLGSPHLPQHPGTIV